MIKVFIFALFLGPEGQALVTDRFPITEWSSVEECESVKANAEKYISKNSPYPFYVECFQGTPMELTVRINEVGDNLKEFVTAPGEDA